MDTVWSIFRPCGSRFVRVLACAITVFSHALVAHAGPCDVAWDGDKIVAMIAGRPASLRIPLRDTQGRITEVTVDQIQGFNETRDRISRVVDIAPSFIICSGNEPNAFATSGANGEVVGVTIGMLKLAGNDRDMAAAVIGHEFAHHKLNHHTTAETRDAIIGLLAIIAGVALDTKIQRRTGVSGIGVDLAQLGGILVSRKFSRDQEREADEFGFKYMVAAEFNPNGAIRLANWMNRLGSGGAGWFFDTHPGWSERGDRFRAMIAGSPAAQQIIARTVAYSKGATVGAQPSLGATEKGAIAPEYTTSDAQKSYANAIAALRTKDVVTAVREFRAAASAGYAPAQVIMGYLYETGRGGLSKDDVEAARLFRLAAAQGNALGQANLGWMYETGRGGLSKDDVEAVRLFRLATDQGDALGQANLGWMYVSGRGGLSKDEAEAVRLFRLAANQGNALGQANLGSMYFNGKGGLAKDGAEALRLYRLAAAQGNALSQVNLGLMYATGSGGLAKDDVEAVRLLRLAADQGNELGQASLGNMYETGRGGLSKDEAEAVRLFRLAANQGNALGQANLGSMYFNGKGGLAKDDAEALRLYRLAAAQGNALGQANLGWMYATGRGGLSKDEAEAVRLFRLAATQGNALGQNNLGAMSEFGRGGLPKNTDEAILWYQKAAAQGNSQAIANLKRLGRR